MERQTVTKVPKTAAHVNHLQTQSDRRAAAHPLLRLQGPIGNHALQRLINSPYIQTKLHAQAFTVGEEVALDTEKHSPKTNESHPPLGHDSTHLAQQRGAEGSIQRQAAQPSSLWAEVNDAHHHLFALLGGVNQRVPSSTRSDWINQLSSSWAQVGEPGQKGEAELKGLLANLNNLKKEIAEEAAQAHESWKVLVEAYNDERKSLEAEDDDWVRDAIKILNDQYAHTARVVQVAGAYLTFDDLISLQSLLSDKKHREYAQVRAERERERFGAASTAATGAGLGAVVTYQGKTLVRLGGEKFYISGTPPKGTWTPKGGTTSVLFIYKKSDPKKMYRLDYDTIKMGSKQGQMGWEHNQKGVAKVLGLKITNHQPAGGWGRVAGNAIRIYKWGGRALFVAGLIGTALEIYYAENKLRAVLKAGGGIAGAVGGAKVGAIGGAKIGAFFGPKGAVVGALLGGLIGGGLGAWGGSKVTEYVYDLVATPLEEEEDWVVLPEDQVEPVPAASEGSK